MRWLVLALMTEGSTDNRFLSGVFYRQILHILDRQASQPVEVQEYVIGLDGPDHSNEARVARICAAKDAFDILGLHADASRSGRQAVHENIVGPITRGASTQCGLDPARIVPILPAMCDPDAIARCCGFSVWPKSGHSPPAPAKLESLRNPKELLNRNYPGG